MHREESPKKDAIERRLSFHLLSNLGMFDGRAVSRPSRRDLTASEPSIRIDNPDLYKDELLKLKCLIRTNDQNKKMVCSGMAPKWLVGWSWPIRLERLD